MELNGASAIVTGGASGIGAATARQLADLGARVVIADMQAERGQQLAEEIGGVFVPVDVTKTEQIGTPSTPRWISVRFAHWSIRPVSAGRSAPSARTGEFASAHDLDAYRKVIAINLVGTFDCIRLAATAMSRLEPTETGERGAIVNMTSVAAFDGQIGQAAYSSSRGVVGLTLPVARDLAAVGIGSIPWHRACRHPIYGGANMLKPSGQTRSVGPVPAPSRQAGGTGLDGIRADHQLVYERRGGPRRRWHPDATEVAPSAGTKRPACATIDFMDCDTAREALSARIDGEREGPSRRPGRRTPRRLRAVPPMAGRGGEQTTAAIGGPLAGVGGSGVGRPAARRMRQLPPRPWPRWALGAVGVLQLGVAAARGTGAQLGLPQVAGTGHVLHESTAWSAALGVAMLAAAIRPLVAAGLTWVLGAFATFLVLYEITDTEAGRVTVERPLTHLPVVIGRFSPCWCGGAHARRRSARSDRRGRDRGTSCCPTTRRGAAGVGICVPPTAPPPDERSEHHREHDGHAGRHGELAQDADAVGAGGRLQPGGDEPVQPFTPRPAQSDGAPPS